MIFLLRLRPELSTPAKGSASLNGISAVPTAILKGKAWVFGDDINTDIIIPFRFKSRTNDPYEMAKYAMYGIDPDFHKKISKGDLIVGGKNFGGGSSREQAPVALKYHRYLGGYSRKFCTDIL